MQSLKKLTKKNILVGGGAIILVLAGIFGFTYSKKVEAETIPANSAVIEVTDKNGTRTCDIYPDSDADSSAIKKYAEAAKCNVKLIYQNWKDKLPHKDEAQSSNATSEAPAPVTQEQPKDPLPVAQPKIATTAQPVAK